MDHLRDGGGVDEAAAKKNSARKGSQALSVVSPPLAGFRVYSSVGYESGCSRVDHDELLSQFEAQLPVGKMDPGTEGFDCPTEVGLRSNQGDLEDGALEYLDLEVRLVGTSARLDLEDDAAVPNLDAQDLLEAVQNSN